MPRTLPWEVNAPARRASTPVKTARRERGGGPPGTGLSGEYRRTPSTSPVRAPPSEELMIEGLEGDDQYIMVEDEFLTTARAFTAHLHQAEYARKKQQARAEHATKVMSITRRRSTDSRTPISNEIRSSIKREASDVQHRVAMEDLKPPVERSLTGSELVEENGSVGASEEDQDDDPWVGTSLQPLMVNSDAIRPLVGLHGMKSSTKAALGYLKATSSGGAMPGETRENESDVTSTSRPISNVQQPSYKPALADDITAASDDDNLDMSPRRNQIRSRPTHLHARRSPTLPVIPRIREPTLTSTLPCSSASTVTVKPEPTSSPIKQPHGKIRPPLSTQGGSSSFRAGVKSLPTSGASSSSRFAKFLDELDEPAKEPGPSPVKRREVKTEGISSPRAKPFLPSEETGVHGQDDDEQLRKKRLSQVPTFL